MFNDSRHVNNRESNLHLNFCFHLKKFPWQIRNPNEQIEKKEALYSTLSCVEPDLKHNSENEIEMRRIAAPKCYL